MADRLSGNKSEKPGAQFVFQWDTFLRHLTSHSVHAGSLAHMSKCKSVMRCTGTVYHTRHMDA